MASAHGQRVAAVLGAQQLSDANALNGQILQQGYGRARDDFLANSDLGLAALGQGYDQARGEYANARTYFQPYADAGRGALGTYQDSLGLNGPDGYNRTVSTYQHSPGYDAAVTAATDGVARQQSALGALGSGNTMQAIATKAQDLQNLDYGKWQDRLAGLGQLGYSASGAQAGLTKGIGDLDAAQGGATAGLYTGRGTALGNLDTGLARDETSANTIATQGIVRLGQDAGQASDAAKMANENLLLGVAGLGLRGLGLNVGGGKTIGGSIFNSLGSAFG